MEKKNNYEMARDKAAARFAKCDQEKMIDRLDLIADDEYIYLSFLSTPQMIDRKTGRIRSMDDMTDGWKDAGFDESLTIYDILDHAQDMSKLSGEFTSVSQLTSVSSAAKTFGSFSYRPDFEKKLDKNFGRLRRALEDMNGEKAESAADLAYKVPLYEDIYMLFEFYRADDEFPAKASVKWDTQILSFMHYETLFYATGYFYSRILDALK